MVVTDPDAEMLEIHVPLRLVDG
jgi:hypothetical protein